MISREQEQVGIMNVIKNFDLYFLISEQKYFFNFGIEKCNFKKKYITFITLALRHFISIIGTKASCWCWIKLAFRTGCRCFRHFLLFMPKVVPCECYILF